MKETSTSEAECKKIWGIEALRQEQRVYQAVQVLWEAVRVRFQSQCETELMSNFRVARGAQKRREGANPGCGSLIA